MHIACSAVAHAHAKKTPVHNSIIITIIPGEEGGPKAPRLARFINLSRGAPLTLIVQRGRNLSCEYFYRSLGVPQLMLSSCDVGYVAQWSRINFHLQQIRRERVRISGEAIFLTFVHFFCLLVL